MKMMLSLPHRLTQAEEKPCCFHSHCRVNIVKMSSLALPRDSVAALGPVVIAAFASFTSVTALVLSDAMPLQLVVVVVVVTVIQRKRNEKYYKKIR